GCPVAAFQKMISGKYKLRIVWDLKDGPRRYGDIRTGLLRGSDGTSEIAPRVLSRELKALTESGLIDRRDYGVVPPKVEYRLTRKGKSFVPVIAAIKDWGTRHLAEVRVAEMVAAEWRAPLHLAGEERIGHPLLADAGARAVAADEADIVAERQQLFLDRVDQRGVAAAGQLGPSDRAVEQDVADMGEAQFLVEEHDAARRMAGAMQDVEGQFADRD